MMQEQKNSASLQSYIAGFVLSVFFTLLAYIFVQENLLTGNLLVICLLALALAQAFFQMYFFLHLGKGSIWNLAALISTVAIILILVLGSLWIMRHLNYNMTPQQMDSYLMKQEGMMQKAGR